MLLHCNSDLPLAPEKKTNCQHLHMYGANQSCLLITTHTHTPPRDKKWITSGAAIQCRNFSCVSSLESDSRMFLTICITDKQCVIQHAFYIQRDETNIKCLQKRVLKKRNIASRNSPHVAAHRWRSPSSHAASIDIKRVGWTSGCFSRNIL